VTSKGMASMYYLLNQPLTPALFTQAPYSRAALSPMVPAFAVTALPSKPHGP
jgi:hypothetical protein